MTTERVYKMSRQGIPIKYTSSGGMIVGGAVAVLRNSVIKDPAVLEGNGLGANQIVGIYSPAPPRKATDSQIAQKKPTVFQGGELLNKIAFEPYMKKGKRDNIKFLF